MRDARQACRKAILAEDSGDIEEAIRQLKEPLDHPWKKYGDLILEDEGIIRIGYSTLISVKPVSYSLSQVFVDPTVCDSEEEMLKYFIQGIFSFNCAKNKSGLPTFRTICNEVTGDLLDEAKAQWASAFVTN